MRKYLGIAVIVIIVVGVAIIYGVKNANRGWRGMSKTPGWTADGRLQITASFYPLSFFAQAIGGDRTQVYNITPAGVEPHDYELTPKDVARIEDGSVLVLNGANLEPWGDKIQKILSGENSRVEIVTTGNLAKRQLQQNGQALPDPHLWLSPPLAKLQAGQILEALIKADPAQDAYFQTNAAELTAKLDTLDQAYRTGLRNCEREQIVTSHAAFGYLADTYGLKQVAITGLSPDAEPSSQDLAQVVDFVKKERIPYIFFESLVSPKLSETIASEAGAQTLVLDPIEGLTDNDLRQGKDYFTQMYANLAHLQLALSCKK